MASNESRSLRASVVDGSTDGKYRKQRPDTTVQDFGGAKVTEENREGLNPWWGYGYLTSETRSPVDPGTL